MKPWLVVIVFALLSGCIITPDGDSIFYDDDGTFTLYNESSYDIEEFYLRAYYESSWGSNQLGGTPLYHGDSMTIDYLDCDTYEAMVVDDTGLECVASGIYVCESDEEWVVRDSDLDYCYDH